MYNASMNKALNHFKKSDPILYEIAKEIVINQKEKSQNYFIDLVESIISQQLSIKAADTIFNRFQNLFINEKITPEQTLKIDDQKMRNCGISFSKIRYIKGIAEAIINQTIDLNKLDEMTDDEVITELTKLKGVGKWTAEMFLMFSLSREDIFSTGDLGLQNAVIKVYGLKKKPTEKQLLKISKKWSPHRTYASRILWKSLEIK